MKQLPNIWSIMSKVRLEAFLWGAGTALGELPPYFMAKAARLSGYDPDDAKELAEFEALKAKRNAKNLGLVDRGKLFMERVVERIGFFGILACASVRRNKDGPLILNERLYSHLFFFCFRYPIHCSIWPALPVVISWCHFGRFSGRH